MSKSTTPSVAVQSAPPPEPFTPGYTGAFYDIPLAPCCRSVFLGEVCGCLEAVMTPDLPPILLDLRQQRAVA